MAIIARISKRPTNIPINKHPFIEKLNSSYPKFSIAMNAKLPFVDSADAVKTTELSNETPKKLRNKTMHTPINTNNIKKIHAMKAPSFLISLPVPLKPVTDLG